MSKYFYEIIGFGPPSEPGRSRYGFSIYISAEFANRAYQCKISQATAKRFQEMANEISIKAGLTNSRFATRMSFLNDSFLLRSWAVPGDCSCMGIDGNELGRIERGMPEGDRVEYHPHNVDSMDQAFALLSIFLMYAEFSETVFKMPKEQEAAK